jgi:epoxyqueuosine reductase
MEYLKRRDEANRLLRSSCGLPCRGRDPSSSVPRITTPEAPKSIDPASAESGWIARYAWTGDAGQPSDYHDVLLARLKKLEQSLQQALGPFSSPLLRGYGSPGRAGLRQVRRHWLDRKEHLHHRPGARIMAFSGGDSHRARAAVRPNPIRVAEDRCGSCTRCIDACPTGALVAPYQMDASLCISYLTIEKRGPIAEPLRAQMGRQVFGCDICQDVCPWNRRAPVSQDAELAVRPELVNPALAWLAELDAESFRSLFRQSPVQRTKLSGLLRNVAIAMGNSGLASYLPKLREWAASPDPCLRRRRNGLLPAAGSKPQFRQLP